jgi:hypothetical protein
MAAEADSLPGPAVSAPRLTPDSLRHLSRQEVAESATRRAGIVPSADCVQAMIRAGVNSLSYQQEWTRDVLRDDLQENPYFQAHRGHRDQIIDALLAMAAEADSLPGPAVSAPRLTPDSLRHLSRQEVAESATRRAGIVPSADCVQAIARRVGTANYAFDWVREELLDELLLEQYFQTNTGHCDQIIDALVAMAAEADASPGHGAAPAGSAV